MPARMRSPIFSAPLTDSELTRAAACTPTERALLARDSAPRSHPRRTGEDAVPFMRRTRPTGARRDGEPAGGRRRRGREPVRLGGRWCWGRHRTHPGPARASLLRRTTAGPRLQAAAVVAVSAIDPYRGGGQLRHRRTRPRPCPAPDESSGNGSAARRRPAGRADHHPPTRRPCRAVAPAAQGRTPATR